MNSGLAAAALCAAVIVVLPSSASAARPATPEERAAVSAVYQAAAGCSQVAVSERDPRYARWDLAPSAVCEPIGNGFGIARRDEAGAWRDVYQASDRSEACPITPLPTAIGVELRACLRPSRRIYITNFLTERTHYKPRKLPHGAHSFLGTLRWRGWNHSIASARGVLDYADRTARFRAPIRLRAYRVRFCGAKRHYTRLRLRFLRAADRQRYQHFEGSTSVGCPR